MSKDIEFAPSVPLRGLSRLAPPVTEISSGEQQDPLYPLSNDDSAHSYQEATARYADPAYRQTENRVAVIVGEGSLSESLALIKEETIVILDGSANMHDFMKRTYVPGFRSAATRDEWNGFLLSPTAPWASSDDYDQKVSEQQAARWDDINPDREQRFV